MSIINVNDLCFSYNDSDFAVNHVSFSIEEGSYTTIIGHNGSGKSTLAKLLIGLLEAKQGSIEIAGMPLDEEHVYAIREQVGVVFQNPDNQFIGSTVADDIAFGLENHQVPTEEMQSLIEEFASKVGMQDFLNSEPTKLSGGQKQRVAIAGVLAMKLNIIILDEATSMLDPKGKREINALIEELHKDRNLTIISITHDMEEVTRSDYAIVLDDGKVKMQGKPEEILLREEALVESKLDVPFALKLQKQLADHGIEVSKKITIEGIVEELCQLNSKN